MVHLSGIHQGIFGKSAVSGLAVMIGLRAEIPAVMGALIAVAAADTRIDGHEISLGKLLDCGSFLNNRAAEFVSVDNIRRVDHPRRNRETVQITAADAGRIHADQNIRIALNLRNADFLNSQNAFPFINCCFHCAVHYDSPLFL